MIKRTIYKRVVETIDAKKIPVIIGLRRIGKTTILEQLKAERKYKNARIIDWDSFDLKLMKDIDFFNYLNGECKNGGLLLFDEVQSRNGWDIMIKNFYDRYVCKDICNIVVTGSSSMILSGKEMGVDRTRRLYLDTWSFDEYIELTKKEKNFTNFEDFFGRGFPEYMNDEFDPLKALNETLKPILIDDIPIAFPQLDTILLARFLNELASLSSGEVNETNLSKKVDISIPTVRKYIEILVLTNIIKKIYKVDERGILPKKKKYKIFINPHIHIWLLKKKFYDLDNKFKGHIIESYWLHWVFTKGSSFKEIFYLKDSNTNKEIDFVTLNVDGSFKTLHEFKYIDNINMSDIEILFKIKSDKKLVWGKKNKIEKGVKLISILDINSN